MQYRIDSTDLELEQGTVFTTVPIFSPEEDDLVLFEIDGRLIVGHWRPDILGSDWVEIPKYMIHISGTVVVIIIGLVSLLV